MMNNKQKPLRNKLKRRITQFNFLGRVIIVIPNLAEVQVHEYHVGVTQLLNPSWGGAEKSEKVLYCGERNWTS